jgi:hypothetical protein
MKGWSVMKQICANAQITWQCLFRQRYKIAQKEYVTDHKTMVSTNVANRQIWYVHHKQIVKTSLKMRK